MRWYSVKKFKPACIGMDLIVRNGLGIWIGKMEDSVNWVDSEGKYFEDDSEPTHFAIPDPIEIEE